jgi:hypothetical protein
VRSRVPENCTDFTSVALAFYDESNAPVYAMVILKRPGTPVGQGVLRLGGDTPVMLRPATWYTLNLKQATGQCTATLSADRETSPDQPTASGRLSALNVNRIGVRVYGSEVEVADLQMSGSPSGKTPS